MIKSEELMLGNVVYRLGQLTRISSITKTEGIGLISTPLSGVITINQIDPVPLTPEILTEWCGIVRHKPGIGGADMWQGMPGWSLKGSSEWILRGSGKSLKPVGNFNCNLNHLHELQNWYYWNSGKQQLTIKIPNHEQ